MKPITMVLHGESQTRAKGLLECWGYLVMTISLSLMLHPKPTIQPLKSFFTYSSICIYLFLGWILHSPQTPALLIKYCSKLVLERYCFFHNLSLTFLSTFNGQGRLGFLGFQPFYNSWRYFTVLVKKSSRKLKLISYQN